MKPQNWILLLAVVAAAGCGPREKPNFTFMPDMAWQASVKAQEEGGGAQAPVKGTVARGHIPYAYANQPEEAGRVLKNPLRRTKVVLDKGKDLFNIYCLVCHGPMGEGDGTVVPKFPRPPSLQSDKVRQWSDGRIYHVIVAGQNLMPSYAGQVPEEDRWAIIHYVRVLQRAKNPSAEDLKAAEKW